VASKIAIEIGVRSTSWNRITGAGYAASPRRYSERGMPMLLEFTWPDDSEPMRVSPALRCHTSRATSAYTTNITIAASADTGSSAENSVCTSAWESTTNSRKGDRTKNVRRPRTCEACGPSRSMRPSTQPRKIARPTTTNPVSTSSTLRA